MIRYRCPSCLSHAAADNAAGGTVVACAGCGELVLVPTPPKPVLKGVLLDDGPEVIDWTPGEPEPEPESPTVSAGSSPTVPDLPPVRPSRRPPPRRPRRNPVKICVTAAFYVLPALVFLVAALSCWRTQRAGAVVCLSGALSSMMLGLFHLAMARWR